jgi:hypothetical protein
VGAGSGGALYVGAGETEYGLGFTGATYGPGVVGTAYGLAGTVYGLGATV